MILFRTVNMTSWVLKVQVCSFKFFFFKYKPSLSSSPIKILYLNLVYFLIEQARAYLSVTWLTYSFSIYYETITKMFYFFTILLIFTTNRLIISSIRYKYNNLILYKLITKLYNPISNLYKCIFRQVYI